MRPTIRFKGHSFIYIKNADYGGFCFVCENCKSEILERGRFYWFWAANEFSNAVKGKSWRDLNGEISCDEAIIKGIIE